VPWRSAAWGTAVLAAILVGCSSNDRGAAFGLAECEELATTMLVQTQEDLLEMEAWPDERQGVLLANPELFDTRSSLVYLDSVLTRVGNLGCTEREMLTIWCHRITDLVATTSFGEIVRAGMIVAQCAPERG
jgi:hypothetical protein